MDTATVPLVRRSVTVHAPVSRAFTIFTENFGSWWPRVYTVSQAPDVTVIMDAGVGGRWYELGSDGSEVPWGQVRVWEPPHRVVLAWHLDDKWEYRPDLVQDREIEVRFSPLDDASTRVDLDHRGFPLDGVWLTRENAPARGHHVKPLILRRYADAAAGS